ncbi:MAG: 6-phospho-beta-glucosidase [bacterium]
MKVAIIGGGSSYTPELLDGLFSRADALELFEICLYDVDRERLEVVSGFCHRMAEARSSRVSLVHTLDLSEALKDSSFVIAQVRVGGNAARREDERLGMRHNLIGQETTGVGGFMKALRTVPEMIEIAKAMEKHSPHAFLINFTNPSGIVTEALIKHSSVKVIGLCNIPVNFYIDVARAFSASRQEVELDYIGLNHLSWVRRVQVAGKDVTGKILEWSDAPGRPANLEELDYPRGFVEALGMIPMHYLRYYYMTGMMIERQRAKDKVRAEEVMEIESELMDIYRDPESREKPEMLSRRGGAHYSLAALELIESICFDRGDVQVLDVKNHGAIPGLSPDAAIEVPCRVDSSGAVPLALAPPEPAIKGLMEAVKSYEELTVEAAVERDYDKALLALAVHPLGPDADHAEEVLGDIIKTHGTDLRKER